MMALEPHGPDTYVGVGPSYPWGGLYGGQIVAQALRAAGLTVDDDAFRVHSLHAYFIRSGDSSEPIRLEVDRVRNGRTFCTRRVVARQAVGAILALEASFQVCEDAPDVQSVTIPDVAGPDEATAESWSPVFERNFVTGTGPGRATGWMRMTEALPDDPMLRACALAYVSDDLPTDAVVALHPDRPRDRNFESYPFFSASLDHAIWFHRDFAPDAWHVHDYLCHGLLSSRGLALGHVFTPDGTHTATITQEVLLRRRRDA